jgi:small conductance mechanosensitive channel
MGFGVYHEGPIQPRGGNWYNRGMQSQGVLETLVLQNPRDTLARWGDLALTNGAKLIGILLLAYVAQRILKAVTRRLIQLAETHGRVAQVREQQTRTVADLLYSTGTALIYILAVMTALPIFGLDIRPIIATAGLASLAIGFGAQHVVRDLINGFFIVLEDQFVVGDMVKIGEASGRVEHLTLRRTVIRDVNGALFVIPNGEIRALFNLSRDWSQIFIDVTMHDDDRIERALAELENVCAEFRSDAAWSPALVDGPRVLGVESFVATSPVLRLQVRTSPGRQHDVARELRRRIKIRLEQARMGAKSIQRVEVVQRDAAFVEQDKS